MKNLSDEELVEKIEAPNLLLIGDKEYILGSPTSAIERAGRLLPNLEADIIPDAGHLLSLDQPELVTARILEFLRE